ncbi:AlpA family phage regulatory protein [Brevundimonas sp. TWP2-3-2]|uniref:helix-turn-helix transcriptional regulator n=1 Tax=unclassified Brevundimonas TaxID=2622653 RepID=UPI003CF07C3C
MIDGVTIESGGPEDRLLPWERVQDIIGISRTTAWRMENAGTFPSRVTVSPGRVGWWESELTAWKSVRSVAKPLASPRKPKSPPKALSPPVKPRLPGMARRAPLRSDSPSPHPVPVQLELPAAPPLAPQSPLRPRRRAQPTNLDQSDFGF